MNVTVHECNYIVCSGVYGDVMPCVCGSVTCITRAVINGINSSPAGQNGHCFTDSTKHIFLNGKSRISIRLPLKFVSRSPIDNKLVLAHVMVWRLANCRNQCLPGQLTHICRSKEWSGVRIS